jgi:hypothetical protein
VQVSFSDGELGSSLSNLKDRFTSEEHLQSFLNIWRRGEKRRAEVDGENPEVAIAEYDREIGLDQALAQLRAGLEEIKAAARPPGARRTIVRPRISVGVRWRSEIRYATQSRLHSPG